MWCRKNVRQIKFQGLLTCFLVGISYFLTAQSQDTLYLTIRNDKNMVINTYVELYLPGSDTPLVGTYIDTSGRAMMILPKLPLLFDLCGRPPVDDLDAQWWLKNHPFLFCTRRTPDQHVYYLCLEMEKYIVFSTSLDPPTHDYEIDYGIYARSDPFRSFDPSEPYIPPTPKEEWWMSSSTKIDDGPLCCYKEYWSMEPLPIPNQKRRLHRKKE